MLETVATSLASLPVACSGRYCDIFLSEACRPRSQAKCSMSTW